MEFLNTLNVLWTMFGVVCMIYGIAWIINTSLDGGFYRVANMGVLTSFVIIIQNIALVILGSIEPINWWILLISVIFTLIMLFAGWIKDKIKAKKTSKDTELKAVEYKKLDEEWDNKKD